MNCVDKVAPMKNRKHKIQKHKLPNHVIEAIQRRKSLYKEYEQSIKSGSVDKNIERKYKKTHNNYTNRLITKAIIELTGRNIHPNSNLKEIWDAISDILRP